VKNDQFIFALKSNRSIALNKEDKAKGRYTRIDSIQWSENPVQGWVKWRKFPYAFMKDLYFPPFLVDCFKGGCRCA
jgi:hypothetical protein